MKRKKGQIQLGESIFVVIIIIVLIVFGLVFYSQAQKESTSQDKSQFQDLSSISLTQYTTSLSEVECSSQEVQSSTCFDTTKLTAFILLYDNTQGESAKEFYFSQLGNAIVYINETYPVYDNAPQRYWLLYSNYPVLSSPVLTPEEEVRLAPRTQVQLPVSLHDPIYDITSFGVLTIIQFK